MSNVVNNAPSFDQQTEDVIDQYLEGRITRIEFAAGIMAIVDAEASVDPEAARIRDEFFNPPSIEELHARWSKSDAAEAEFIAAMDTAAREHRA